MFYHKFFYWCCNIVIKESFNFQTSFTMLARRNYMCPQYKKRMKSTSGLIRHLNAYTSLLLHIQPDRNSPILAKKDDVSDYFMYYNKEKYPLDNKRQDVEKNQRNSIGKSLNNKSVRNMLPGYTPQDGLLGRESSSFLRDFRFSK